MTVRSLMAFELIKHAKAVLHGFLVLIFICGLDWDQCLFVIIFAKLSLTNSTK